MTTRWIVVTALLLVLLAPAAHSEGTALPARVQMEIFSKIWTLDRSFSVDGQLTVAVIYQAKYRPSLLMKDAIIEAGKELRLNIRFVAIDIDPTAAVAVQFPDGDLDFVYIAPLRAIDVEKIIRETRKRRIRTMTAVTQYVDEGVAVGLEVRDGRPQIVVNLPASRAEGSNFSSHLLKLARIVR